MASTCAFPCLLNPLYSDEPICFTFAQQTVSQEDLSRFTLGHHVNSLTF